MTYYKYAEREAPQQVNWAEIGTSISNTLLEEKKRREDLKAQIDKDTREIGKRFEDAPMGKSVTFNNWTLDGVNAASQLLLQQEREMKAGRLDYKDYIAFRQNMNDSVDSLYKVVNDYNAEFERKLERSKAGESGKLETYLMEQVEGFQNFSETGVYWDPMKGNAAIAKKQRDENGNVTAAISKNPADMASLQSLQSRIRKDYNRYDVEGNMASVADSVGEELLVVYEKGIATEADPKQKAEWQKAEDDLVGSVLTSPDNAISVLLDYAERTPDGEEYYITESEEEANKNANAILLKTDNNGNVYASFDHPNGKRQMEEAKEALKANLRIKLDRKQTALEQSSRVPTEAEYKRMDGIAKEVSLANSLGKFYYGGDTEVASASGFIQGLEGNEDIVKIMRTPDGLIVERKVEGGTTTEDFPFVVNGALMTQEDWIASVYTELTPGENLDLAVSQSSYRADREFNPVSRRSYDVNLRPDIQPLGDIQFEIGKDKFGVADLFVTPEGSDRDVVDIAVEDTERVLNQLPDNMTSRMDVRRLNDDELEDVSTSSSWEDAIVIDFPEVLTAPIIVPNGDKFSDQVRSLVSDLYKSAAQGKRRAPASYRNFFDAGVFEQYNNENSAGKFEYPVEGITGEVFSRAGTEATATEQFSVIDIENLPENAGGPLPSIDATPAGATPVNVVDETPVTPATPDEEVDALFNEFINSTDTTAAATPAIDVNTGTAVTDTTAAAPAQPEVLETGQPADTATVAAEETVDMEAANEAEAEKKNEDPVALAIEEEAAVEDVDEADRRMATNLFKSKKAQLRWPTPTTNVSKPFDANTKGAEYNGVEISTDTNTVIKPSFPGVVTKVIDLPLNSGKAVIISHGDYRTVYSNLRSTELREGDEVTYEGVVGYPVGESLNFQVWKVEGDSVLPQNPQEWLVS